MSATEQSSPPVAASRQEEAPESAAAIADRILGNTNSNFEMSTLPTSTVVSTASPPTTLPQIVSSSGNVAASAPAVTNAEAGTAAAPIAESSAVSEALHDGAAPVSPSDIVSRSLIITIILTETDKRHRLTVDDKYLAKRSVSPPEGVITNMSVYTLKELIWRDWHSEWNDRPTNPSSIRLIHMGRLLEDNTFLRDNRFQVGETPHVVHMNVRPTFDQEEDTNKLGKSSSGFRSGRNTTNETERTPGCRCILM